MHLFIFAAIIASALSVELESQAKLLASKTVENNMLVQNKEMTIKYRIFNVGTSSASKVKLVDETFPAEYFETVRGHLSVEWQSIPVNANVTHIVVLKPLKEGYYNFTSAVLSYVAKEGADVQNAFTSFPGEGGIMSEVEYARKHSPHLLDWSIFALMCMPSLVIPFALWYRSHSKYVVAKPKKQ